MMTRRILLYLAGAALLLGQSTPKDVLEQGFREPPNAARPHVYWLWLNGYVDPPTARAELQAMKDAGFGGVLIFDMGARGDKDVLPPAGPAFLSPPWMKQFHESVTQAKQLGLQVDFSVISSWDLGGHWIEPRHGSMGLYTSETLIEGGRSIDAELVFPPIPPAAPREQDGKPNLWRDAAVLAARNAKRASSHEFIIRLDPHGDADLKEVVLDNGNPGEAPGTSSMSPVREFSVAVSGAASPDTAFREIVCGSLPREAGPRRFPLPPGTRASYIRLRLISAHDSDRPRWTLGEVTFLDTAGAKVAATIVRPTAAVPQSGAWNRDNLFNDSVDGPRGVFATAGLPPFEFSDPADLVDVTARVDSSGRLRWDAPTGTWTILRYVVMNTGERLKIPSPNSNGWATDHFNSEATRAHMDYVVDRIKETFGDPAKSGLTNLYLASYEVVGPVWSPSFIAEFRRLRGYDMTPFLPAVFGARVRDSETTERFLFDYRKTLSDVLIGAYYVAARDVAHKVGLGIKSEAGGPGPPAHNVPVDALLANSAVDAIQGEFWPYRPQADAMWVVKETASAGHIYGKTRVHMESFTSSEFWREGPQDLKPSADRVLCEGANHFVWHTWPHGPPEAGKPGWVYHAGTHINRNVTWWPKVRPFVDYLSRASFLLQRGQFVGDVLYYYGDGGYKFVGPRRNDASLGPGYDYDYTNSDVILNRLSVRDGRFVLPDGTSYAVLVLPSGAEANPTVLDKIEKLVAAGGTVLGPRPSRAVGLEGYPASDARVREIAATLWGDLDGLTRTERSHGKGRIIWGKPVRGVLMAMGIQPDFTAPDGVDFTHRHDGSADIYFVRNTQNRASQPTVTFRVKDRTPELWDPLTGAMAAAPVYRRTANGIEVPLEFASNGSVFVVFRRPLLRPSAQQRPAPPTKPDLPIEGPWTVRFEAGQGAPESLNLTRLASWAEHSDPRVKYFAGTARYVVSFNVPKGWKRSGQRAELDLGRLWAVGEAWLNGKPLGVVWTAPFRADCTEALREGTNELAVEVTNTWYNRLIGDSLLPPAERITRTNVMSAGGQSWAKRTPLESGLFGPVRILAVAVR